MKKIMLPIAALSLFVAACGAGENREHASGETAVAATAMSPATATTPGADIDPVCGMERDSTWTDYALYQGDTVWFCAAPEKTAFLANPGKYIKADSLVN